MELTINTFIVNALIHFIKLLGNNVGRNYTFYFDRKYVAYQLRLHHIHVLLEYKH